MTTLQNRIKKAMKEADNMKPVELAKLSGVSRATVSLWINGPTKTPEGENLLKVARALNINPNWLATGAGKMYGDSNSVHEPNAKYSTLEQQLINKFRKLSRKNKDRALGMIDVLIGK